MEDRERIAFKLDDERSIVLILQSFDEIDTDEVTQIQHHNIIGELLTCSAVLNRLGNVVAVAEEALSESKLDYEVFYAQKYEEHMKALTVSYTNSRGRDVDEKPSSTEIEQAIKRSPDHRVKMKNIIRLQKQRDIINSLYWAVKSKDDKLNRLTDKIRPEEFGKEIIEGEINGILIKVKQRKIV